MGGHIWQHGIKAKYRLSGFEVYRRPRSNCLRNNFFFFPGVFVLIGEE